MPKDVKSIRLSQETLKQFEKYADLYEKIYGKKPTLGKITEEALPFYINHKINTITDKLSKAINALNELQDQKNEEEKP